MTTKRDFKRRVRARQARTGESYVTARRRLLAERRDTVPQTVPGDGDATREVVPVAASAAGRAIEVEDISGRLAAVERPGSSTVADDTILPDIVLSAVPVVELHDVSVEAAERGFRCRIAAFPLLIERLGATVMLDSLRDALVRNRDPAAARLFGIAFGVALPGPVREPRSSVVQRSLAVQSRIARGGFGDGGSSLIFHVHGRGGIESVLCIPDRDGLLVLAPYDLEGGARLSNVIGPPLYLIYRGRRQRIIRDPFVIGRNRPVCDLVLRDGSISRKHAVVICHAGCHYIKDLGSTNGIVFRGMRIDHKRIVDGDVFRLGEHELHFSYGSLP